jgi:hypothetical protein
MLEAFARSPQAYSPSVSTVTAKLVQDLLNFSFLGDSADDIKLVLHPFIITDGNAKSRHTNREVARLYGYLHAGEASISLADLEALQAKVVCSVPLTYWELEKTLGTFGNLISTVLGVTHPLCVTYKAMWTLLQSGIWDDLHTAIKYPGYVKPTHILCSIQLQFWNWFVYQSNHLTPPTLDFVSIINHIPLQLYVLPHLPPALYQLAYPKKSPLPPADASLPGLIIAGGSTSSSSLGSSGSPSDARDKPGIKIRDMIASTAPPKMDNGTDMCKGCWSNYRRGVHRGMPLSAIETQRMESYIKTPLAALALAASNTLAATGTPAPG